MKNYFIITILIFLFIQHINAQSESKSLPDFIQVVNESSLQTISWLVYAQGEVSNTVISYEEMEAALDTFGVYNPTEEYRLAKKYQNEMKDAFRWFKVYGDDGALFLQNFTKPPERIIPFRFAKINNKIGVVLADMVSSKVYNTLQLTSKKRAAIVLESYLLPKFKYLYDAEKKIGGKNDANIAKILTFSCSYLSLLSNATFSIW